MRAGEWDRFVSVAVVCFLSVLAAVATFCVLYLCCWGFRRVRRALCTTKSGMMVADAALEKDLGKTLEPTEVGGQYRAANTDYIMHQTDGFPEKGLQRGDATPHLSSEREINLRCAPFTVDGIIGEKAEPPAAKLKIRLSYRMLTADSTTGRLTVCLMEINSLPHREYLTSLEPYVVLDVINNKWPMHKNERIVRTVQSRVVRHSFDPKFDQTFLFDVKKSEMKDWCLKFTVFDKNRLIRSTPICERRIFMRDVKNLTSEPDILLLAELREICSNNGQILFGVSYLPTAQRLNISVVQASELKFLTVARTLDEFNPYVRVLILNGQGKCIKKKKTGVRYSEESPIFNETLAFDVPISSVENTVFLLVLCSKILGKGSDVEGPARDAETWTPPKESKDEVLGAVAVGKNVKSSKGRNHWLTVMQNPRKVISVWHRLK